MLLLFYKKNKIKIFDIFKSITYIVYFDDIKILYFYINVIY